MGSSGMRIDSTRSTVLRAVNLLHCFGSDDAALNLAQLSRRSGLAKTTTHRLVADLVASGLLHRGSRGFSLGPTLFELGHLVPLHRHLRDAALPFLQDLHDATGMTVNLAIRDGGEIVYVEKLVQRSTKVPHTRAGGRLPAHCTALGKAILAFSDPMEIDHYLAQPLVRLTSHSHGDESSLRHDLADIRRGHVAFDHQESSIGLFCVASPVTSRRGVVGAISVTGATAADQTRHLAPAVITTAKGLSRSLGAESGRRAT